ncbi:hypothetical protein AQS70_03575 [Pseudomonas endophytica]|uniref:Sugar-binding protein n=1 Tax=Pseudomonas endophytica TaxID=1563157 RepID=A0A0Q0XR23_9PSED|nr:RHS repeat domain-containing protein [Pseudomonas endophytica]KQB52409.1 hypothetical protein AQS70_03575 [Pseudomonas endophytica]
MATSNAVHSNAFNFMSYLTGGVDPRTGQYSVAINLPDLNTNDLMGPMVPLSLVFSALNMRDSGFGPGWSLQQTEYNLVNKVLSLSSGETYRVTGATDNGQLVMDEKKLDTFRLYKEGEQYRVVYKSGITEILRVYGSLALPVKIYSREGRQVNLSYLPYKDSYLLSDIKDGRGETLLDFVREDGTLLVRFYPYSGIDGSPLAVYKMVYLAGDLQTTLLLPTEDNAHWLFRYINVRGYYCISEVETPTGSHETIYYEDEGHQHPDANSPNLPRVTRHLADPGCGQPVIETVYGYDLPAPEPKTHHNFLGFGAPGLIWNNEGIDNLYQVTGYDYSTVEYLMSEGREVQRTERTFNSFHLLTEESTTQNGALKRVRTTYHARDVDFESQPNNFQLPKTVETFWSLNGAGRSEVVATDYDEYGNLVRQVDANGVAEISTYYGLEAEDGCPADPEQFVRNLKETLVVPADSEYAGAPTLATRYRYIQFAGLDPAHADWLSVESETLLEVFGSNERTLQTSQYHYYDDLDTQYLYGRVNYQNLNFSVSSESPEKDRCFLIDFEYSLATKSFSLAAETVLHTITTTSNNFDQAIKVITSETSLIHGQSLLVSDENNVTVRYTYDVLMRVVSEVVSPDDPEYRAERVYAYTLYTPGSTLYPTQTTTNVKGVKTQTLLDGFNRVVGEKRQNADAENRNLSDLYRDTYTADYDVFGHVISEVEFDWLDDTRALELKTTFTYDDWGQQLTEIRPDGVQVNESTNPIGTADWKGKIITSWSAVSDSSVFYDYTVTKVNVFDKPVTTDRFDGTGELIYSRDESFYDGLGRLAKQVDAKARETLYTYDAYDRVLETTLPNGVKVVREYALHSSEDLPTQISVAERILGTQSFDGLDRLSSSVIGGRKKAFTYKPGELQPCSVTTARGQTIEYNYLPQLGEEPIERRFINEDVNAYYVYDSKDARLCECSEDGQFLAREYFSTGEVKKESVSHSGNPPLEMSYKYSLKSRLLSYTDVLGQLQTYTYKLEDAGRMSRTELGDTASDFTYNSLGLVKSIYTVDCSSSRYVSIALEYDVYGREILRTFDLNGIEQILNQQYDEVDNLVSRVLSEGDQIIRSEKYFYDTCSRLDMYECTGTQPPIDPFGRPIAMQMFSFDDLDNITEVRTSYADGGMSVAEYHFKSIDPVQLTSFSYSIDNGTPTVVELVYDADGNMVRDEAGRIMEYDELNRLKSVSVGGLNCLSI